MDDQQAREAAALRQRLAYAEAVISRAGHEAREEYVQDQRLITLNGYWRDAPPMPVASRSDIPEQSRQANEEQIFEALANRLGEHPAAFNVFDITDEATTCIKLNEPVEELAAWLAPSVAALVSSPSEQSAAPKEAVAPAREAILRETVIREVLDHMEERDVISFVTADLMREHFGVSS